MSGQSSAEAETDPLFYTLWKPFPMISLVFEIRMKASLSFSRIKLRRWTACIRFKAVRMIYLSLPEYAPFARAYACASSQRMYDIIADWLGIVAYDVKIFGQVKAFDERIDHKRADRKTEQGKQSGFYVENEKTCGCDQCI